MYQHLLVPIDASPLSAANVQAAVQLARSLGARITFFHATADYLATGEGALLHAEDHSGFELAATGVTNVVLFKALASAEAAGVQCKGLSRTSDRPAEAIVEAATQHGADLIVMASRGLRGLAGWLHSSQTERVLRQAPVALLVTRVAANEPLTASERALGVIHDEHRSIAVVMKSLRRLATSPAELTPAELHQIELLVGYLRDFPQRLHHPKEEQYLHRCLRTRHPASNDLLAELEAQHVREAALITQVQSALPALHVTSSQAALREAVSVLLSALGAHMALEETSVFAMAREYLQNTDWEEIATAFESHDDPRFGDLSAAEFDRLFARIANLKAAREGQGRL